MAVTKLTEFKQSTFIVGGGPAQRGICYYICEYMESNKDSPWKSPKDFAAAKVGVTRMRTVALVAAGKAANLQKLPQGGAYADATPLKDNSLYRVELAVGAGASINHETMMLTGEGEIILFDPNFGFYDIDAIGVGGYHTSFEAQLTTLYGATAVGSFGYSRKRKAY
jgi:hypothetical protein